MRSCRERERGSQLAVNPRRKLDSKILKKHKEKRRAKSRQGKANKEMQNPSGEKAENESWSRVSPAESPLCDSLGADTGRQANKQGRQKHKGKQKMQNVSKRKPKRKPECNLPNRVAIVVISVSGLSMHAAKARVHRSESGSLLAGVSEKEALT